MTMTLKSARVSLMLAEHATVAPDGKLYINGGGLAVFEPQHAYYIVAQIEMPWESMGMSHQVSMELVDQDGHSVTPVLPPGMEAQPLRVDGGFEAGAGPGMLKGSPLIVSIPISVGPCQLPGGQRYEWRLTIDGQVHEDWRIGFQTRPDSLANAA